MQSAFVGWSLNVFPTAGEATGAWVQRARTGGFSAGSGDPERSAAEAARRATSQIRRFCAANGLNRFGTLTYAGDGNHDPLLLRRHLGVFFRRLRALTTGGSPMPYVWVPEWHKTDHGLHAHFAVDRYLRRSDLDVAWPHGFHYIKLVSDLPVGSGRREEARQVAVYLAKYAAKDFDKEKLPGLHRYEVAQGFQPEVVQFRGRDLEALIDEACSVMGGRPISRWQPDPDESFDGPPRVSLRWA